MESRNVSIVGTGMAVPGQQITSEQLDRRLGLPPGTSFAQTGVARRYLSTTETAAQLAAGAATMALADAGLAWDDIDCLVVTSATMDQALPYNAALLHAELGLSHRRTATFDINASCLSFLTGLDTMSYLVAAGRYRHVLLVAADIATFGLDWTRLKECGIFGDGAAAAIIRRSGPGEPGAIHSARSETLSAGVHHCRIPAGGSRFHPRRIDGPIEPLSQFQMEGKSVFRLAAAELPRFAARLLDEAGTRMESLAALVPHQASQLALDHLAKRVAVPDGRLVDIFAGYGNQVAASLPTALHLALSGKRVRRGERLMLLGTGAGLSMGGMVLTY